MSGVRASGRCLCGAVEYEVRGVLRNVVNCHCEECARWNGGVGAYAAARSGDLEVSGDALRWIESPQSDRGARRGFCADCGSSLFWVPQDGDSTSIAAGTLDRPTRLQTVGHWYTHQAGDYYELPADGLPRDDGQVTAVSR
jgi:hypothetical protein